MILNRCLTRALRSALTRLQRGSLAAPVVMAAVMLVCSAAASAEGQSGAGRETREARETRETHGPVYPIIEPDMLVQIRSELQARADSGELARLQSDALARSRAHAREPITVQSPARTTVARTYRFDPTVIVNRDIRTPDGVLIAAAGSRFNPLEQVALEQPMLFFDARDPAQSRWARELMAGRLPNAKPILTGGDYIELQRTWRRRVYVDQAGVLTRRLGIHQVPAAVTQEGRVLRIDEVALVDPS